MMLQANAESVEFGRRHDKPTDSAPIVIVADGTHVDPDLPVKEIVSSSRPMAEAVLEAMAAYPDASDVVYVAGQNTLRARSLRHIVGALRDADHNTGGGAFIFGNTEPRPQPTWRDAIANRLGRGTTSSQVTGNVFGIHRDLGGNVERLVSELPDDISTGELPEAGISLFLDREGPGGGMVSQPDVNLNVIYLSDRLPETRVQDTAAEENDHFYHGGELAA